MTFCELWTRHHFLFADTLPEIDRDYHRTQFLNNEAT